ncbi:hypothetical protein BDB00DRAFT_236241 [Zychaea mexicana]|uniref:uncharacterized protein n=1 Tax=Zychaea mexicana TaxID=64656 RepID=UPI0022FED73F|nr:uncharacterized protein BDB00DRAFT_236241 [Zychaea mexicana]KAI9495514.1 hypothetical protein BDB00DRAFT_236241 [Zychaea mexicana]
MPCKHEYHGKCIRHWLGVSTTCPMCRSTLPEERPPPSEQQQQQQQTANSDPLGGRTYTFQSPAGTTTVGVWVADPSTLPPNLHYPHHHSHHRHHHPFDDDDEYDGNYNDENDFLDALDHVFDDDDDENDDDPYYDEDEDGEEDDEDEDLLWGLPHHPMMHVCPHGYPRMPPATLRERPAARPAASSATTPRTNQQGSQQQQHAFRQVNPMDELD